MGNEHRRHINQLQIEYEINELEEKMREETVKKYELDKL